MAFKMKGSAFKLGNVATKSALKETSPMKGDKKTIDGKEIHVGGHEGHHDETPSWGKKFDKTVKKGVEKGLEISGVPMKSPLEQEAPEESNYDKWARIQFDLKNAKNIGRDDLTPKIMKRLKNMNLSVEEENQFIQQSIIDKKEQEKEDRRKEMEYDEDWAEDTDQEATEEDLIGAREIGSGY